MDTVSCVIPAYNEEKGIADVLSVMTAHPLISEVIVVDDGSTDRTKETVREFPTVRLIVNEQNRGKTASVCRGVLESAHPYLFLIDADLTGLTADNVSALIEPVLRKDVVIAMSLKRYYPWRFLGFDPITGERVMPRSVFIELIPGLRTAPPFSLEIFINRHIIASTMSFTFVPWLNVSAPIKSVKHGLGTGLRNEVRMWQDIMNVMPPGKLIQQFYILGKLSRSGK